MNASGLLISALTWGVIWSIVGWRIGTGRGRPVLGAVLGFVLGLIGLGIFMLIPRTPEAKARRAREQAAKAGPAPGSTGLRPPASGPDWTPDNPRQDARS